MRIKFETTQSNNNDTAIYWGNDRYEYYYKIFNFNISFYTLCKPIFCRTLFPCQDSPSKKSQFSFRIKFLLKYEFFASANLIKTENIKE